VVDVPFVRVPALVLYVDVMAPFENALLKVLNTIVADAPERTA
jgi:hypothetical protein